MGGWTMSAPVRYKSIFPWKDTLEGSNSNVTVHELAKLKVSRRARYGRSWGEKRASRLGSEYLLMMRPPFYHDFDGRSNGFPKTREILTLNYLHVPYSTFLFVSSF